MQTSPVGDVARTVNSDSPSERAGTVHAGNQTALLLTMRRPSRVLSAHLGRTARAVLRLVDAPVSVVPPVQTELTQVKCPSSRRIVP